MAAGPGALRRSPARGDSPPLRDEPVRRDYCVSPARSARSKNTLARIQVRIAWARIHALDPDPAAQRGAIRVLAEARADSTRYGFYPQLLEARFGEGEAEAASGNRPRARACFTAVERDARARGFTLLARRAAERGAALRSTSPG